MARLIDLHLHSTASDGKDTPIEIVRKAKNLGLKMIAITDHDSVEGYYDAYMEAKKQNIKLVSGVEMTVTFYHPLYKNGQEGMELDVLGYGFNPGDEDLRSIISQNNSHRTERIQKIRNLVDIKRKNEKLEGFSDEDISLLLKNTEGSIGRPHLGQLMVEKGWVSSIQEAFERYLREANVPKKEVKLFRASYAIRNAGGIVGIAHPIHRSEYSILKNIPDIRMLDIVMKELIPFIDFVEVYYNYPSKSDEERKLNEENMRILEELANKYRRIKTGGSDAHGGERDYIGAIDLPQDVTERILAFAQAPLWRR